jgi:hypothetical protein
MEIKGKTEELLVKTTQYLWKECAKTHWLHQKTKPETHVHWRKRRGSSKRDL